MTSGKKPPITDFNFGQEARIDDAKARIADGGAGERGDGDGGCGPGTDDRVAGCDGATSALLGWAGPARQAPAYVEGLPGGSVTSIGEIHTRTISIAIDSVER
jgi:hypothetical protein